MALAAADRVANGGLGRIVETLLDGLAGSRLASALAVLIVAACCQLPGLNTIPPIDRDEPAFAMAARGVGVDGAASAAAHGPPGMAWLEAGAVAVLGGGEGAPIWMYRLPSLLAGIAAAVLTWWAALAFKRPRAALVAGLLMASSVVLAAEARLARPDAVLLAAVVLAEGALARLWLGAASPAAGRGLAALLWVAVGAGILVKGVVAPLVLLLTIALLTVREGGPGWLRRLHPAWGLPLLLVLLLPWLVAILAGPGAAGGAGADVFARYGRIIPDAPPGSYLLLSFAIFWPASSFVFLAVPWLARRLQHPAIYFGAAWLVPFWLIAELWPEKLPHYLLPVLPGAALLAGIAIDRGIPAIVRGPVQRFLSFANPGFAIILALGTPLVILLGGGSFPYAAVPALALSVAAALVAWRQLVDGAAVAAAGLSVVSAVLIFLASYGFIVTGFDRIHLSPRILAEAARSAGCADPEFVATGYAEPSLALLAPGRVRFADPAAAADFLDGPGCRVAIVEARQLSSFRQRAEDLGIGLRTSIGVRGINLGTGRRESLRLFVPEEEANR